MKRRLSAGAGDKEAPAILSVPELEARRWDGYRGMVAPQLLGSWNWPGASLQAGYETRMRAAIDAMLCRLPFWYTVRLRLAMNMCMRMCMCSATILQGSCACGATTDVKSLVHMSDMLMRGGVFWVLWGLMLRIV